MRLWQLKCSNSNHIEKCVVSVHPAQFFGSLSCCATNSALGTPNWGTGEARLQKRCALYHPVLRRRSAMLRLDVVCGCQQRDYCRHDVRRPRLSWLSLYSRTRGANSRLGHACRQKAIQHGHNDRTRACAFVDPAVLLRAHRCLWPRVRSGGRSRGSQLLPRRVQRMKRLCVRPNTPRVGRHWIYFAFPSRHTFFQSSLGDRLRDLLVPRAAL